jgi:hypothetical protein
MGAFKALRLIRLDIVCVTDDNTIVNVEMQMAPETYFLNRMVYYSSRLIKEKQSWSENPLPLIQTQMERTQVPWNYQLPPVYVIAICDFPFHCLPGFPAELHNAWLCWAATFFDGSRCRVHPEAPLPVFLPFDNVSHFCLVSLPSFTITADACKEPLEQLLWLLQHLGSKIETPDWVEESKDIQNFMETVRISKLSAPEYNVYQKESAQWRTLENTRMLAIHEAKEEGRQELLATLRAMDPAARDAFLATQA